jgi:acetylornithine/N-succinyldiaminopimelate aminotransferase
VKEIRGRGLMIGVELTVPCGELLKQAADHGLLLSVTADTVIRMVPSLIMTTSEADEVVAILCPLIKAFLKLHAPALEKAA